MPKALILIFIVNLNKTMKANKNFDVLINTVSDAILVNFISERAKHTANLENELLNCPYYDPDDNVLTIASDEGKNTIIMWLSSHNLSSKMVRI